MPAPLTIPAHLLPQDGRFGSGPSKVRHEQVEALVAANPGVLGTSHRQAPVKDLVGHVRRMIGELYDLPAGYEVLLGNGGSTFFWDAAAFSLVDSKAQHCACGEFGSKFAQATAAAPHLDAPTVIEAPAGSRAIPVAEPGVDVYAWAHNETSTGVFTPVTRPDGIGDALVVVDGTSAAGGITLDVTQADAYYFAPQKSFAADGGLWFALVSPAAVERIERISATGRYVPQSLDLAVALENSRVNQTLNTPAVATLVLMKAQLEWMLAGGGLEAMAARSAASTALLYEWAEASDYATPFVDVPEHRSPVVATIDLVDDVSSERIQSVLRENGVVDVFPYRKLGRNQLRVGCFPAVDTQDVARLIDCIDWVVAH